MSVDLLAPRRHILLAAIGVAALGLSGCGGSSSGAGTVTGPSGSVTPAPTPTPTPTPTPVRDITGVTSTPVATFAAPWAFNFLADGRMLVTERASPGRLHVVTQPGGITYIVSGLPANDGLLDIVPGPGYASDGRIYFSFVEQDAAAPRVGRNAADATVTPAGLAVAHGRIVIDAGGARMADAVVIWRQRPKIVSHPGSGEYGGKLAFSPDGRFLFVAAGDRQEFDPVQALDNSLGKIVRLHPDGSVPTDNPFASRGGALPEIWTLGHRNPYGLAFDASGTLWSHEMGPLGGDEFNLVTRSGNYGWPNVSYGSAYSGEKYPDPKPGDGYVLSATYWTPVIAPAGMIFYAGNIFTAWKGSAIIGGLQSKGLVRVRINGTGADEVQRVALGARIRDVRESPDGSIWVLEDAPTGRLLKLAPVTAP